MLIRKNQKQTSQHFINKIISLEQDFIPKWYHPWFYINRKMTALKSSRLLYLNFISDLLKANTKSVLFAIGKTNIIGKKIRTPIIIDERGIGSNISNNVLRIKALIPAILLDNTQMVNINNNILVNKKTK